MAKLHVGQYKATNHPKWEDFIGKNEKVLKKELIGEDNTFVVKNDSLGVAGFRNVTYTNDYLRVDVVCETADIKKIKNGDLLPVKADWLILDVFCYHISEEPEIPFLF
jgi:hypothetical protein